MYTLKDIAEAGYIMGLPTIGDVIAHITSHADGYRSLDEFNKRSIELHAVGRGHEEESIFKYITDENKARMDEELEKAMDDGPELC